MSSQTAGTVENDNDSKKNRRSSSRNHKKNKKYDSENETDDDRRHREDAAVPSGHKSGAFDVHGLPIVERIPYLESLLLSVPGKHGQYMFREHLGPEFDKEEYYNNNKKRAWSIITSTKTKSEHALFGETGAVAFKTNPVLCQTPISSIWQSPCGRFVLFPKGGYVLPDDEDVAKLDWFPSVDWMEYLTTESSDSKYNIRNGTNWDKFEADLEKLNKRVDVSASESEHPFPQLPKSVVVHEYPSKNSMPPPPPPRPIPPFPPVPTAAAKKNMAQSSDTDDSPSKQLIVLAKDRDKDAESAVVATDEDEPIDRDPKSPQPITEKPSKENDADMVDQSVSDETTHPKPSTFVVPASLISRRPGGRGFKPSTFGKVAAVAVDPDPDFQVGEGTDLEVLDDSDSESEYDPKGNKKSVRGGRGRGGRGWGRRGGGGTTQILKKKVPIHPTENDIIVASPNQPSPTTEPPPHSSNLLTGTPGGIADDADNNLQQTENTEAADAMKRQIFRANNSASVSNNPQVDDQHRQDLQNTALDQVVQQLPMFEIVKQISRTLGAMDQKLEGAEAMKLKLEEIDRKMDFYFSLSSKTEQFFIAPRGSDFLLHLTQRITGFTGFPFRATEEAEHLEELCNKLPMVVFSLIVYLSSVIAGGNVGLTSGFLWDKMFSPELADNLAWATIGEVNQGGMKAMGKANREKYLFRQKCPMITKIMYHVIRRKVFNSGHEIPNVFLMNEHIKLARAVSACRSGQEVEIEDYRDQTSRSEGIIPLGMFCDDLDQDAQVALDSYHDDLEANRRKKCITCSNRKQVAKPPERKRDPNVKNPERDPIPRPNRRMNNSSRLEYEHYAAFAHRFVRYDLRLLEDIKDGRNFLDSDEVKNQLDEASELYHDFLMTQESQHPVSEPRARPHRLPSPTPPPPSPPPPVVQTRRQIRGRTSPPPPVTIRGPTRGRTVEVSQVPRSANSSAVLSSSSSASSSSSEDEEEPPPKKRKSGAPADPQPNPVPKPTVTLSSTDDEEDSSSDSSGESDSGESNDDKRGKQKAKKKKQKNKKKKSKQDESEKQKKKNKKHKKKKKSSKKSDEANHPAAAGPSTSAAATAKKDKGGSQKRSRKHKK